MLILGLLTGVEPCLFKLIVRPLLISGPVCSARCQSTRRPPVVVCHKCSQLLAINRGQMKPVQDLITNTVLRQTINVQCGPVIDISN